MLFRSHATRRFDTAASLLAILVAASCFLHRWWVDPQRPVGLSPDDGWRSGFDQHHYLASALAFARLDLSPASHWYLPAYPALAGPFARLLPSDPFMPVDLCCLLLSVPLSGAIGAALAPGWRWGRAAGLAGFLACGVLPAVALEAWVMPWTSTLAVPLILASLYATLTGIAHPGRGWPPFLAGMAAAAVCGCRPADAALLLCLVGVFGAACAWRARGLASTLSGWLPRFLCGAGLGCLPTLLLYLLIWGPHESPYLVSSALVGFDADLLLPHWVELVISPRPLVAGGEGLVQRLPFMGLGLLGLVAVAVAGPSGDRARHGLAGAAILGSIASYLCYRDLHAPGLWTFFNYHYFKWSFGLLGFYAILLARTLSGPRRARLLVLAPVALLLFCWRVVPLPVGNAAPGSVSGGALFSIPVPALGVRDAIVAAVSGPFDAIYFGAHALSIGGHEVAPISDYKALPIAGGLIITPLRRWPAGRLDVRLAGGITLSPRPAPFRARLSLRFGLPCWFGWRQSGCDGVALLPPPAIAGGATVALGAPAGPALLAGPGWAAPEPGGRWTVGSLAELSFRTVPADPGPIVLTLSASAIWRQGVPPFPVLLRVGSAAPLRLVFGDGSTRDIVLPVPSAARGADGTVILWVEIPHPRAPATLFPGSRDVRPLGLFVRSLRWSRAAR